MNPTTGVLEERLAALEGGAAALAVASGHAAQVIVFHTLMEPGCNIMAANKLYGGSINQLGQTFRKLGWESRFVVADATAAFAAPIAQHLPAILIESLANHGGVVTYLDVLAPVGHKARVQI